MHRPGRGAAIRGTRWAVTLAGLAGVAALLVMPAGSGSPLAGSPAVAPASASSLLSVATLADGARLSVRVGGASVHLWDTVTFAKSIGIERSYLINVLTSIAEPGIGLRVVTRPLGIWSLPGQLPGGADFLPGIANWSWSVYRWNGKDDTANWTLFRATGVLTTVVQMLNTTFQIVGFSRPTVQVQVNANRFTGTNPPAVGFVIDNPGQPGGAIPANDSDFRSLPAALRPALIRWSQYTSAPATWDNATRTPSFDFHGFGPLVNLSNALHAKTYVSLPAGSWGDGNVFPAGMPLNRSLVVTFGPDVGYFPATSAYVTYVRTFVSQVVAHGWHITYWNIGNEVPVKNNLSVAAAYTQLFNAAASAILKVDPSALVGSDVMLATPAFSYIAAHAQNVGYLSFHFYVGQGTCNINGRYCVPNDSAVAPRDPTFWASNHTLGASHFVAPAIAQQAWYNATGDWVPVFDSESNLNKAWKNGTDPRQQTLFGAAWVGSTLIDAALQNVSEFTYFALGSPPTTPQTPSGPYGGWGFGLTNEGTADNDTTYAPYWALKLWSEYLRPHEHGVWTTTSNATLVRAYAARNDTGVSVALVNRAAVPIRFVVNVTGLAVTPVVAETLDQRSYVQVFNPSTHTEQLVTSGVHIRYPLSDPVIVRLNGYGVAVVRFSFTNGAVAWGNPSVTSPASPSSETVRVTFGGSSGASWGALLAAAVPAFGRPGTRNLRLY